MNCKIYYINLDHRTDRKHEFLGEMQKLGISESRIVRIPGIYKKEFGSLGCGLSHKKALETFYESGESHCMIFEDDFQLSLDINFSKFLLKYPFEKNISFDLIMLAGNIWSENPTEDCFLRRVLDGQTVSGILITREFAPKLIQAFSEATKLLEDWWVEHKERKHEYCIDIYWKKLQPESKWYILNPKLGVQRKSYSDNEYKITDYGV